MNEISQIRERRSEERLCELMRRFSAPCAGPLEAQLIRLKNRLLQPIVKKVPDSGVVDQITAAANEAATLAWYSGYPILLFPALLEEKLSSLVNSWNQRSLGLVNRLAATTISDGG